MFRIATALLRASTLPLAAETRTVTDDHGTLNPQDSGFGRVMSNIDNGVVDMPTCATGYYITKSGRHAAARCARRGRRMDFRTGKSPPDRLTLLR